MLSQDWGYLYKTYHNTQYNLDELNSLVETLFGDPAVTSKKGIYEYVLGGCENTSLLNIRLFDNVTIESVYFNQTNDAKENGTSNCPLCAASNTNNNTRIYKIVEMDADHVTA